MPRAKTATPAYSTVHRRMRDILGPASAQMCACGEPAMDWSYDNGDPDDVTAVVKVWNGYKHYPLTLTYSDKPEHYIARCRRCHRAFDLAHRASLEELLWLL